MENTNPIQPGATPNPQQPVPQPQTQPAPLAPAPVVTQPAPAAQVAPTVPAQAQAIVQPTPAAQVAPSAPMPVQPQAMPQTIGANPVQPVQQQFIPTQPVNPAPAPIQRPAAPQQPMMPQGQPMANPIQQQQFQQQPMPQGQPYNPNQNRQNFQYQGVSQGMPMQQPQQMGQYPQQNMPQGMPQQMMQPGMQAGRPMPRPTVPGKTGGPSPKKFILGCLGFVLFSLILFVIFVIVFVSQTTATGTNGLAASLGVDPAEFTNSLILITNLIFGVITIITFFIAVFGLFRAGMSPKTDHAAKSSGFRQAGIAGTIFLIMVMLWVFVYIFLSGKKVDVVKAPKEMSGIITEPVDTTKLTAPIDIKFDASKIQVDPKVLQITFYQWDFGDNTSSNSPTVTHTYTQVGQYPVKLTVSATNKTTNAPVSQTFEKLVTVSTVKVAASFDYSPQSGPAPLSVEFDASGSSSPAGTITSYEWDFKGQNNFQDASGETASYTFQKEGTYTVKLRVTDNSNQQDIVSKTITVGGPDIPIAVIDIPTDDGKYYIDKQISFLAEKSTSPNGSITKYQWDFGDDSPKANTRTANHTYKTPGLYEVILTTTDEAGKVGTSSQKINLITQSLAPVPVIASQPAADEKSKAINGQAPLQVSFDANQSTDPNKDIVEYKWDFNGDGTVDANGSTVSYSFNTPGVYNTTLTVIDAAGNETNAVVVVNVAAQGLKAKLVADKFEGNAPLTVTFDASSSTYPDGQIASFEWDFGDGTPKRIDASKVSYEFAAIGTFKVHVTAKASDGKTDTAEMDINVRPISLQSCFTPSTEQGPAPLDIELDPRCSQGAVAKYLWDFGDGQTSRVRKPTHTFDKPGSYQVTLQVTDNTNVVNTFSKNILVTGVVTP